MNEMLEKILSEIQGLKKEMNLRFKEQDERIEARFKEQDETIEKKIKEQDDKIAAEFKNIYQMFNKVNERFDIQTKELAQELRTVADFIYERDKKLFERLEEKLDEEIKYNRAVQKAYDARFSKIELYQEALESKVYDLITAKKAS